MNPSIWTQSTQDPSIFSHGDSLLSSNTQWSSEAPSKLEHIDEAPINDIKQAPIKQTGRPRNKWTGTRLRELIKLYLLTDLELEGIIDRLRTEDFQPCKRDVQEKLKALLQPDPRTIRPKGDTNVLRNLLRECNRQQEARRRQKRQRRRQLEQESHTLSGYNSRTRPQGTGGRTTLSIAKGAGNNGITGADSSNITPNSLDSFDQGEDPAGFACSNSIAPASWANEEFHGSLPTPIPMFDFGFAIPEPTPLASDVPASVYDWRLQDCNFQPQSSGDMDLSCANNFDRSMHFPIGSVGVYGQVDNFPTPFLDVGFNSDFGLGSFHPTSGSWPGEPCRSADMDKNRSKSEDSNAPVATASVLSSIPNTSPQEKCLAVNPTYVRDTSDNESSFLSLAESYEEFDFLNSPNREAELSPSNSIEGHKDAERSSFDSSPSESEDEISDTKRKRTSDPLSSISKLSTMLSKISLTPPSTGSSTQSATALSGMFACPIVLPGAFPEYCWQHINQNTLRRCPTTDGSHNCHSKRSLKIKSTHRSLRADVLARIIRRNLRPADIHEVDTFGNSTLHIAAATLAPSTYLIHLINLGANINSLNTAGQTFLHLFKPEVLEQCADFCSLLEVLSTRGFNFSQHDHLGQSPLHLLMRPWIHTETLRQVITKIDSLPIHSQLSTARDCLGYTIAEQLNLQETSSSWQDVDQAILSLACETHQPIANQLDLQLLRDKNTPNESQQLPRNYENHPSIETIQDLVQYEQHVDHWRTILAAKQSPWFEDLKGRNGLHCLAEASLVSKDKRLPDNLLAQLVSLRKASGCTDNQNERECLLDHLLSVGVDPNNYDKAGNTPLMAFINHLRPAENDSTTTQIINCLLKAGSDICRRNRQGETALHLAVKLGRRAATKALLVAGANIHARTRRGLGVLELGQRNARECRQDSELYAQIMLCLTISASFGAVARPTILDEWGFQWKIPADSRREKKGFTTVKNFIVKKARGRRLKG
ncbi:ankyrin [Acephala macrosclerotiorum]|nr:ankyrin [Acephala macrosclerotiorum]